MVDFFSIGYFGLFFLSFSASTILPLSSEPMLTIMLGNGYSWINCLVIATIGNSLGSFFSYYLGRLGKWDWLSKYFKIQKEEVLKYQTQLDKYGSALAFFVWLPIIGDVMAIALGYFRLPAKKVFPWIAVGKLSRYSIWMYLSYIYFNNF